MQVALLTGRQSAYMYTVAALRALMRHYGVAETSTDRADAFWVSVCDPDELPVLVRARQLAGSRPVVMGGFEAWFGLPYLAWADAVVVGEATAFVRAWAGDPAMALGLPCVLRRDGPTVQPCYDIDWPTMPLVKVSGRERYYYLAAKGCRGKCAFCATAWVQPHQQVPPGLLANVVRYVEGRPNAHLTCITNDSSGLRRTPVMNAQSVRVRDYLANPARYKASMLHFGIEGWDEDTRRRWGKPLADEDIRNLVRVTAEMRQLCELFFIVGYPGWSMSDVSRFAREVLELDTRNAPQVRVKCTYLDPCPHTPLGSLPVEESYCDTREVFRLLNSRNKRIRVFPTRSRARSAWRTCLHRCTPEEAILLGPQPTDTNTADSWSRFVHRLEERGLVHLLTRPPQDIESRIHVSPILRSGRAGVAAEAE